MPSGIIPPSKYAKGQNGVLLSDIKDNSQVVTKPFIDDNVMYDYQVGRAGQTGHRNCGIPARTTPLEPK